MGPARLWWRAIRPGFLLVTLATACAGIALTQACGCGWDGPAALATVALALLSHAAANLYNDYGDAVGGSDAVNHGRLTPFSGGSRMVQDGLLQPTQLREAAIRLGIVVIGGGVMLAARAGPGLLLIGLAGLVLAWAYSSPRVALMSRGAGELGVALAWWAVVVGADYVQRHAFSALAMVAGLSPALLVAGILWAAEFPDAVADAQVGKRTLVVRLGPDAAALVYGVLVAAAHLWLAAWWWADWLPMTAWWALGSAPLSLASAVLLWRRRHRPQDLRPAIGLAIASAVAHATLLSAAAVAIARLR